MPMTDGCDTFFCVCFSLFISALPDIDLCQRLVLLLALLLSCRTMWAAFSPIIIDGALVFPEIIRTSIVVMIRKVRLLRQMTFCISAQKGIRETSPSFIEFTYY